MPTGHIDHRKPNTRTIPPLGSVIAVPNAMGFIPASIRTDWDSAPPKQLWKTTVGGGHASITIAQGRLFTMEQWDSGEVVTCYNLTDGRGFMATSTRASLTTPITWAAIGPRTGPTYDDGRLYTLGAEGQLHCLDGETGKLIWHLNIHERFETRNLMFGTCASPWVEGDAVIITTGNRAAASPPSWPSTNCPAKCSGKPKPKIRPTCPPSPPR